MVGYNKALLRPKGLVMTHIETIFGPHGPIQAYMGPARAATVRQTTSEITCFFSFFFELHQPNVLAHRISTEHMCHYYVDQC